MKCYLCGTTFATWEGEHGTQHGQCPTCGLGYGASRNNEVKLDSWEHEQTLKGPCYLIHTRFDDGRSYYSRPTYDTLDKVVGQYAEGCPGRTVSIFNRRTGRAVERFTVIDHWFYQYVRTEEDKKWLIEHGAVIG